MSGVPRRKRMQIWGAYVVSFSSYKVRENWDTGLLATLCLELVSAPFCFERGGNHVATLPSVLPLPQFSYLVDVRIPYIAKPHAHRLPSLSKLQFAQLLGLRAIFTWILGSHSISAFIRSSRGILKGFLSSPLSVI